MDNQRWSHRTKALDDLEVGTAVAIQNQTGTSPTKWDKTGIILENKPNSKVMIKVDGSPLMKDVDTHLLTSDTLRWHVQVTVRSHTAARPRRPAW